jgi:hypothetical protein
MVRIPLCDIAPAFTLCVTDRSFKIAFTLLLYGGSTMAKKKLSRDQKRKAKLAKREKKHTSRVSLAYHGNRYRKDKFVPIFFETELGIFYADADANESYTDRNVEVALTNLVVQLRAGPLPAQPESPHGVSGERLSAEAAITWHIRDSWRHYFQSNPPLARESIIGVLRTLLDSLEVWGTPGRGSRGYLSYLKGFLKQQGVIAHGPRPGPDSVAAWDEDVEQPDYSDEESDDAAALLELGQDWYADQDEDAAEEFRLLAEDMLEIGEAAEVAEVCQQLIGEAGMNNAFAEWTALSVRAQEMMAREQQPSPPADEPAPPLPASPPGAVNE